MSIKFFKVYQLPEDEDLEPSSFYYDLKEVVVDEETVIKCDLYLTTKSEPVELIKLDSVPFDYFESALSNKYDKPNGTISQYIRGDGSIGSFSPFNATNYFTVEYAGDPITLPNTPTSVPFIIAEQSTFFNLGEDTESFYYTISGATVTINESNSGIISGNKLMIAYKI